MMAASGRVAVVASLVGVGMTGVSSTSLLQTARATNPAKVAVGPIAKDIPILRHAAALGRLVRIDTRAKTAEFRISCGWYYAPRRRLQRGLWKVPLAGLTFNWETNPSDPGAPNATVVRISLRTWERRVEARGWAGSLRLSAQARDLSNGPTTDICAGVLG